MFFQNPKSKQQAARLIHYHLMQVRTDRTGAGRYSLDTEATCSSDSRRMSGFGDSSSFMWRLSWLPCNEDVCESQKTGWSLAHLGTGIFKKKSVFRSNFSKHMATTSSTYTHTYFQLTQKCLLYPKTCTITTRRNTRRTRDRRRDGHIKSLIYYASLAGADVGVP